MTAVAWVIALVLAGLAALVLEVFVPSGGVLGFLSVMALLAGVTLAFVEQGAWFGMATLAVTGKALSVWPRQLTGRPCTRKLSCRPSSDNVVWPPVIQVPPCLS
jgi:membrane-bound ClpP family serine protease